jgi:hypothetical protein
MMRLVLALKLIEEFEKTHQIVKSKIGQKILSKISKIKNIAAHKEDDSTQKDNYIDANEVVYKV